MRHRSLSGLCALLLILSSAPAWAAPVVLDFEGPTGMFEPLTDLYASLGVTFENTVTLVSTHPDYNEEEFPPHSGVNVAYNPFGSAGRMRIAFDDPVAGAFGYFTYSLGDSPVPLRLEAYLDGALVGTAFSLLLDNHLNAADRNEIIGLDIILDELRVISGFEAGGFVLDDLTFTPIKTTTVPEPGSLMLFGLGACGVLGSFRRR